LITIYVDHIEFFLAVLRYPLNECRHFFLSEGSDVHDQLQHLTTFTFHPLLVLCLFFSRYWTSLNWLRLRLRLRFRLFFLLIYNFCLFWVVLWDCLRDNYLFLLSLNLFRILRWSQLLYLGFTFHFYFYLFCLLIVFLFDQLSKLLFSQI